MRRFLIFLLASTAVAQQPAPSKQQSINSIQQSSGGCSVDVAGVQGNSNVQLTCEGLSPKILRFLEAKFKELLDHGQTTESDLRNEAQKWKSRYLDLTERFANAGISSGLSQKAKDLLERGEFEEASRLLDQAIASDEKDIDRTAEDYSRLAQLDSLQFRPIKAVEHLGMAYRYRPEVLRYGVDYQMLLEQAHRLGEAETVGLANLKRATALAESDPERARVLALVQNNLGILYKNTSRFKESEKAFADALRTEKGGVVANPQIRPILAGTLNNLAELHVKSSRFEEAVSEYEESIQLFQKLSQENNGVHDLEMAEVITNYGALRVLLGQLPNAQSLLNRALKIEKAHGVGNGRGSPMTLGNLAILYGEMCDSDAAENMAVSVIELFEEWARFSPEIAEPTLAISYKNLGGLYMDMDKAREADTAFSKSRDIYVRLASVDKQQYLARKIHSTAYVATARSAEGKLVEAEALFAEVIEDWNHLEKTEIVGIVPEEIAFALSEANGGLASIYGRTGRYPAAEAAYEDALSPYKQYPSAPEGNLIGLGELVKGIATLNRSLLRPSKAAPFYLEATAIYQNISGKKCNAIYRHELADSLSGLAWADAELHQVPAARTAALAAVEAYRDLRHLDPAFTSDNYAVVVLEQIALLKKINSDSEVWCPIAREAAQAAVDDATKEAAKSSVSACQ